MKIDLNNANSSNTTGKYDVCICGAGVAGITTALELAKKGKKVALFEAGDLEYSEESQNIYAGENVGLTYWGIQSCRLRYLGGASNHWAGRCMQLQAVDFEERKFFDLPGWPIAKSELDAHLDQTCDILDITRQDLAKPDFPQLSSTTMSTVGYAESPPTQFGKKYRNDLLTLKNIDLYLNANLVDILVNDNLDHVSSITIKNYKGDSFSFSGNKVILAMGAIENARVLLNCDSQIKTGIGNHADLVGRCFMEHLNLDLGRFVADRDSELWKLDRFELFPTREFVLKNQTGSSVLAFHPDANPRTYGRLKELKRVIRDNVCRSESLTDFSRKMVHFNCPGDGLITALCEQSPNRDSRILLDKEKDALGLRLLRLDWQINEFDKRTIRTLALEAAKELARMDIARVQLPDYILDENEELEVGGHCHHMGTTRMAASAEYGVVDPTCKVFGIDNLYIASSSVFPTGGGVNPTLPIVQLSLRLAEHINNIV